VVGLSILHYLKCGATGEDSVGDNAEFTANFTDDDVQAGVGPLLPTWHIAVSVVDLRRPVERCLTTR